MIRGDLRQDVGARQVDPCAVARAEPAVLAAITARAVRRGQHVWPPIEHLVDGHLRRMLPAPAAGSGGAGVGR